ncbi:uncharacterized protein LOC142338429 isoform X2 [Convolutriloba macropyga]|uniref:uncharacterized protein LOC142338429 isoform X2 n=1 Tax=Convolutriloba macropyga TaxID=536237 RepID=UPI003F522BE5
MSSAKKHSFVDQLIEALQKGGWTFKKLLHNQNLLQVTIRRTPKLEREIEATVKLSVVHMGYDKFALTVYCNGTLVGRDIIAGTGDKEQFLKWWSGFSIAMVNSIHSANMAGDTGSQMKQFLVYAMNI